MNASGKSPYIGPRTFLKEERYLFFGRDREARDLSALVISNRFVLFYAQSGAGKSSLINTRLIPDLENNYYEVLPTARVSGELPPSIDIGNIYTYNLMRSLIQHEIDPSSIAELPLSDFLRNLNSYEQGYFLDSNSRVDRPGIKGFIPKRRVLIMDQFEELFSTHLDAWEKREDFFRQVAQAMQDDSYLWVVLVMREDYIAALDPYVYLLPGRLRTRYYMQHLSHESALKAMKNPVEKLRPFAPGVAEKLLVDLSSVKIQKPDGTLELQPGQYVEPVQLQVVCYSLWENLPPEGTQITEKDLLEVGDVDDALGNFYAGRVATVAKDKDVKERLIREWIEKHLIAPGGIRNVTLQEPNKASGSISDEVIQALQGDLVRAEKRSGATFYELTHDRLVEPILENNKTWFAKNTSLLQQQAAVWHQENRRSGLLFTGKELTEAEQWVSRNFEEASDIDLDFLNACISLRKRVFEEETKRRKTKNISISIVVLVILFLFLLVSAVAAFEESTHQLKIARADILAEQAVSLRERNFSLSLLLGIESFKLFEDKQTRSVLLDSAQTNPRLLQHFPAHLKDVYSVAFSPDGKVLASGSGDKTIILWDVSSHKPIGFPLTKHSASIVSIVFSPDGKILASGSTDKTIILWDVESQKPIGEPLTGHGGAVYSVAFSPDGKVLAFGSLDKTIIFWDVASRKPIGEPLTGHDGAINTLAFSPDGKILASGSADKNIILWNVKTRQSIATLIGHEGVVYSIAFSPDGKILASGSEDYSIILWDVRRQLPLGQPFAGHKGYVTSIAFSPDGKTLVSSSVDRTIILWSIDTHQPIGEPFVGHSNWVRCVTFSPNGEAIASGGADNMVILWNLNGRLPLGQLLTGHEEPVYSVAFSPDGTKFASSSADKTIILWDAISYQPIGAPLRQHLKTINSVVFSPDGKILASGSSDKTIILWDVASRKLIDEPLTGHEGAVYSVIFSPDGKILASGSTDKAIILWDVASRKPIGEPLTGHDGAITTLAFSPDSKILASGSEDKKIILWDIQGHRSIGQPLIGHEGVVYSIAFSPDGRILASGSEDYSIILWNVEDHQPIGPPFTDQSGFIYSIAISPDGKILASGSYRNSIQLWLWDLDSLSPMGKPFTDNTSTISSLAFSPDSRSLVSGSDDNSVILWDLNPNNWIVKICQRVGRNLTRAEWGQYFPGEEYRVTCPQWPLEQITPSTPMLK